jgi:hypothetical protein
MQAPADSQAPIGKLSRASSPVYGRRAGLILIAADLAKRVDQTIEGGSVLVEQHLAAILGQLA